MHRKTSIFLINLLIYSNYSCRKSTEEKPSESCFTQNNFDLVYRFIENQNKITKTKFLKYGKTKVYLTNDTIINLEKGRSFSKIYRKKGILNTEMYEPRNIENVEETNRLFCDLVATANK
jgi:hypothetical protein